MLSKNLSSSTLMSIVSANMYQNTSHGAKNGHTKCVKTVHSPTFFSGYCYFLAFREPFHPYRHGWYQSYALGKKI